jgi:hypothetical protein
MAGATASTKNAIAGGGRDEPTVRVTAGRLVLARALARPHEQQQEEQRHEEDVEHVVVGVGGQPPQERGCGHVRAEPRAIRESDRLGRPCRHDEHREAGDQGDQPHAGQVLDDRHAQGHGSGRQDRLEQVHPEGHVAERQEMRRDESKDHVGRIARGMARPQNRRHGLELGGIPLADVGGERGDDEEQGGGRGDER